MQPMQLPSSFRSFRRPTATPLLPTLCQDVGTRPPVHLSLSSGSSSPVPSPAPSSLNKRLSQFSSFASILCIIDCTLLPIISLVLPLSSWMPFDQHAVDHVGHAVALYFVLPVGFTAASSNLAMQVSLRAKTERRREDQAAATRRPICSHAKANLQPRVVDLPEPRLERSEHISLPSAHCRAFIAERSLPSADTASADYREPALHRFVHTDVPLCSPPHPLCSHMCGSSPQST